MRLKIDWLDAGHKTALDENEFANLSFKYFLFELYFRE